MPEPTTRQKIEDALNDLKDGGAIFRKFKGDNIGPFLSALYFWQQVGKIAEAAEKASWRTAVSSKVIAPDDDLRDLPKGEHILLESRQFSVVIEIKAAQQRFDLDKFIGRLAKKYKLDAGALAAMADDCKSGGTPPLSKRIVEGPA